MDNDDAIIGTIWSRRQAMRMGLSAVIGGGAASMFLGCSTSAPSFAKATPAPAPHPPLIVSPAMTEGPFFVDEKLNRSNLLAGTSRRAVVDGSQLQMDLKVFCLDRAGNPKPLTGAQVDVWHCDTSGIYSDEDDPMNAEVTTGQRWLRGYQLVDATGIVRFSTIIPGWYDGRATHIHFKVRQFSQANKQTAEFTSQFFFDDAALDRVYSAKPYSVHGSRTMRNTDDGIFSERLKDGTLSGSHQLLPLASSARGFNTQFTIILSDAALHDGGNHDPGGPGGGPGFGPPPGGPPDDWFAPPPM